MGTESKTCPNCKEKNNSNLNQCWRCGIDFATGKLPTQQSPMTQGVVAMKDMEKLKGIGGWLGLYIFSGFLSLLAIPLLFYFLPTFDTAPRMIFAVFAGCNTIACYLLLKKQRNAIKVVRFVLWARMGWPFF